MAREEREFSFEEDMEVLNLTYQMNVGNFADIENVCSNFSNIEMHERNSL